MPNKQILFRNEAREKLLRGTTALAGAVRITLGPKSRRAGDMHACPKCSRAYGKSYVVLRAQLDL